MKNRIVSLFLVLAMLLVLGACGTQGQTGPAGGTSAAGADAGATEAKATTTEAAATTTGASPENPVTVSVLMAEPASDAVPEEMPSFIQFEKDLNIKIDWRIVRSGWSEQKTLVLASGDLPDTFWGNRTIKIADIQSNKDSFVRINDYIDKSTYVKRMFEEEPALKKYVSMPDGSIYSLPHRMPLRPDTFDGMYINKTWLDKLGLPVPDTLDAFKETLIAFRDEDPNGNGIKDEIPYSFAGLGTAFGTWWLFNSFGLQDNVFGEKIMIKDGKLIYTPVQDGFRDCLIYMRDLYAEGLMDPEAFTQDWGMWVSKCTNPDVIMGVSGMWTINTLYGPTNGVNYTVLPPLKGADGVQRWRSNPIGLRSDNCTWSMTTSCKIPDVAFGLIDHIYNPENSVQLYFGSYGLGIIKHDDGMLELTPNPDPEGSYDAWLWRNGFGDMGPFYVSAEFEKKVIPNHWVKDKMEIDAIYRPFVPAPENVFPTMVYTMEDSNEMAIIITDLNSYLNQKMAAWVTGEADIVAEWDAYVSHMNSIGLPRLMEIYNARYELYKSQ